LRTAVHQMVWPAGTARPQPITAFMDGFERPYRAVGGIGSGRQFWGREHAREPSILDVPAPPIRRGRSIQSSDAGCAKHCWIQPGEHRWRERRHGDQSSASGCASGDVGAPELARGDEQRARLDEQTNAGAHGGHRAGKIVVLEPTMSAATAITTTATATPIDHGRRAVAATATARPGRPRVNRAQRGDMNIPSCARAVA